MKLFKLEKTNCAPCRNADVSLKENFGVELAKEDKINMNMNPDIAMKLGIMQAPTFLLLKEDKTLAELKKMSKEEIEAITVTMYSGAGLMKLKELLELSGKL
ncbi:thioredoxin domain [Bacillus phage Izhevsk]|nr:hypothetical protein X915_gp152 [Bacillus phage vB_BanS-Tsamsa]YP_010680536.1 thioredoxin domain [Bacillus phage Izhevsk]AGI11880.1 hypothetical protein [Bacillus phage vB_BanS-Tsamsa]QIW89813.1 thioredoxin [Bacillus phage Izhevsk]